ncbi:MAG: bifunctional diguanylate cyclase/phosphodiesterase, partial [Gammaproteobacteria bacterium]
LVLSRMHALQEWSMLPMWVFAGAFLVSEVFFMRLPVRRSALAIALAEIPLIFGLVFLSPQDLIAARMIGGIAALVLWRRQTSWRLGFNAALFWLEVTLAVAIYRGLLAVGGDSRLVSLSAAFAASLAVSNVTVLLTAFGAGLSEGQWRPRLRNWSYMISQLVTALNTSVALLVLLALQVEIDSIWLLLIFTGLLWVGYREMMSSQREKEGFSRLHGATRAIAGRLTADAVEELLQRAREAFEAERAEITIFGDGKGRSLFRMLVGPGEEVKQYGANEDQAGVLARLRLLSRPQVALVPAGHVTPGRPPLLPDMRGGITAPLRSDGRVLGTLILADHQSPTEAFNESDRQRFEIFSSHVATAVESGQLGEELARESRAREHERSHDPLTAIPNRLVFMGQLRKAMAETKKTGESAALLLLDLTEFDALVEALGQSLADEILRAAAERLSALCAAPAEAYRLEGSQFAVILPDQDRASASAEADRILAGFEDILEIGECRLILDVRGGLALAPEAGSDADTLMRNARYCLAHGRPGAHGVAVFNPESNTVRPARLNLLGELEGAIERDELRLHYQPRIDLATGNIVAAEALVRWQHPRHGLVTPDVFIPLAEWSGLIKLLTRWVFGKVLDDARRCEDEGLAIDIAMKLSVKDLRDAQLADYLATALRVVNLPAERVVMEFTEEGLLRNPEQAARVLSRLRKAGVRRCLEHFGAGYSSLGELRHLEVDEIKIDRMFVAELGADSSMEAVVRAVVELAHRLGKRVVAEGVEDGQTRDRLKKLGCDLAQGYLFSRPMPLQDLLAFSRNRPSAD